LTIPIPYCLNPNPKLAALLHAAISFILRRILIASFKSIEITSAATKESKVDFETTYKERLPDAIAG
jgi:hypothetical protein